MIGIFKLLAMGILSIIAFQDFKTRTVSGWLFIAAGAALLLLFYLQSPGWAVLGYQVLINLALTALLVLIVFMYTRFIRKQKFLDHSMGLGDIFFLGAFALGFPTMSFVVLLVCSLLFALLTSVIFKNTSQKFIPLAGLQALFLILVLAVSFFLKAPSLYQF